MFVGRGYLMTFQDRSFGFFDPIRDRIRAGIGPIRASGPDYLAYALIDGLVDRYYPVVDDLSQQLDELEDRALADPTRSLWFSCIASAATSPCSAG